MMHPDDAAEWEADVCEAEAALSHAKQAQAHAEAVKADAATVTASKHAVEEAARHLGEVKEPRNFVRNNVFAKAGCERTAYHVRSWMESPRCKDDIIIDDDIECMYNATCRVAMFKALREEPLFQQCVPVYSVFYGSPSKIYFNCQDGELAVPCGALDVLERDMTDIGGDERGDDTDDRLLDISPSDDAATVRMKAVRSAEGGQQGCVLATNGCCLPYQKALRKTQHEYPKAEFVIQADDTSIRAASADAVDVHKALKENRKTLCNTVSNVKKVKYFRPGGGVEGIPAEQLEMQGGELVGLKLVGVYLAPDTEAGRKWQRDNLSPDFAARFSVLERVDQLRDNDKNHDVRQLRYSMMRCRSSMPHYWMRTMYPCVVRPVLEEVVEPALKKSFVLLAEASHSPQELIDQAWEEARQDGRFGGCGLGGHAQTADASFAAAVLSVYPSLRDTVALRGMPLSPVAGDETVPMLQHFAQHYNDISQRRGDVARVYAVRAQDKEFGLCHTYELGRFCPSMLPSAQRIPPIGDLFTQQSTSPVPKQGTLAAVGAHEAWIACLAACEEIDKNTPQSEAIDSREATRYISISQFGAAGWLDMRPDGLYHTKMVSAMFLTAIQRRHGLYLSVIAPTLVEKAAAGEHVTVADYKGDFLANSKKGDRTSKHNRLLRAAQNAIRARSVGSIVFGDKEKPEVTRHLNDTSVTDICELGGDFATMRDVHYEVKCWNSLIKSTTSGRGLWEKGGNVASVGHLYGFGNTLDKALTAVVGCKERGRQVDGPLDHSTGKGWVKDHAYGDGWVKKNAGWKWTGAQYYDAKWVKKAITRLVLVETLGGIAPPTKQFLHVFAKEAAGNKTDRTEYGAASASASSFVVHHTQQISMAAVAGYAENINKQARNERKDWLNSSARANWVKNKQEANGFLRSAPVGGACAA